MKKLIYLSIASVVILTAAGCAENQTRIGEGAGIGAGLGALAGGIIGHQSGSGVAGALIGGAAGAAGGALVGSQIEKKPAYNPRVPEPTANVTMERIVYWTKQGDSGDDIINRIKSSHSTFSLTADDVSYLKKQGVSQRVIEAMQAAG